MCATRGHHLHSHQIACMYITESSKWSEQRAESGQKIRSLVWVIFTLKIITSAYMHIHPEPVYGDGVTTAEYVRERYMTFHIHGVNAMKKHPSLFSSFAPVQKMLKPVLSTETVTNIFSRIVAELFCFIWHLN